MKLGPDAAKVAADNSLQSVNDALGRKGAQLERAENVEDIDAFDVETMNWWQKKISSPHLSL